MIKHKGYTEVTYEELNELWANLEKSLKPCPECKSGDLSILQWAEDGWEHYDVECNGCGYTSKDASTPQTAVKNWNKYKGK
jgi:uncharacterized metal-binding protein (TIGR02443 family)